jgi:hypothetical protein
LAGETAEALNPTSVARMENARQGFRGTGGGDTSLKHLER